MAKRGRKPRIVHDEYKKNVFERPEFLNDVPARGDKARAIHMLSKKLKYLEGTEVVMYTIPEFVELFKAKNIKATMNYIKNQLKTLYSQPKVRIHDDGSGKIYIW